MSNTMHEYEGFVRNLMGSDKNERATYALGLAGEAGEVCDLLKKHWGHKHPLDREKLCKELGDVLWYVAAIAVQNGISLRDVAHANVEKLTKRYPDGFSTKALRIIDADAADRAALVAQLEAANVRRADEQRVLDAVEKAYDGRLGLPTDNAAWREVFAAERARRKS